MNPGEFLGTKGGFRENKINWYKILETVSFKHIRQILENTDTYFREFVTTSDVEITNRRILFTII